MNVTESWQCNKQFAKFMQISCKYSTDSEPLSDTVKYSSQAGTSASIQQHRYSVNSRADAHPISDQIFKSYCQGSSTNNVLMGTSTSTNSTTTRARVCVWTGRQYRQTPGKLPKSTSSSKASIAQLCVLWLCRWDVREPSDPRDPAWHWPSGSGAAGAVRLHCRNRSRRRKCAGMSTLVSFEEHTVF